MRVQEYEAMRKEIEEVIKKHGLQIAYSTAVLVEPFSATIILKEREAEK